MNVASIYIITIINIVHKAQLFGFSPSQMLPKVMLLPPAALSLDTALSLCHHWVLLGGNNKNFHKS